MAYSQLETSHLVATVDRLHARIAQRFPAAGLLAVAGELRAIVARHAARSAAMLRPDWRLRLLSAALLAGGVGTLVLLLLALRPAADATSRLPPLPSLLEGLDAGLSILLFLGAAAIYVGSLELRSRRRRCFEALHELRAMAHIVDLHQLTKDPDQVLHPAEHGAAEERALPPADLVRYLEYCTEMLSLIGKVAALYVQRFPDAQAVSAVDDIEDLTNGLSRKVWQKIMILANRPTPAGAPR